MKRIISLTLGTCVAFGIFAATKSILPNGVNSYMNNTTRVIGRDMTSVPGHVIFTYEKNGKQWTVTNQTKQVTGALQTNPVDDLKRRVDSLTPMRYSKLRLIIAAKQMGKWKDVKAFIQANDLEDEFLACSYITPDNPLYIAITNQVIQTGIATDDEVKRFMEAAIDTDGQ